jgi:prepilin-type N-terminal cleavage/methylation domain-containing protein
MKPLKSGFTLVEIMIVVMIIGILATLSIPAFQRARDRSQITACINNLRIIEQAKDIWAIETKKTTGTATSLEALGDYMKPPIPLCPASGTYTYNPLGTIATCSLADQGHVLPPE